MTKHGMRHSPEYKAWAEAKQRCKANSPKKRWYAERGITVCGEWESDFAAFYKHMGPRPPGTSLDRINNDLGYEPGNCRWAPKVVQANNTRANRRITAFGRTLNLSEWAKETGIKAATIWARLEIYGRTPEEAVSQRNYERRKVT